MTGYGKSEAILQGGKLTIEIRTLNGKNADVNLRSSLLPKDKDLLIRSKAAARLVRGTIDIYLSWEPGESTSASSINSANIRSYYTQLSELAGELGCFSPDTLLRAALSLPETVESRKSGDIVTEDNWPTVEAAFDECLSEVCAYREREGEALHADVSSRVSKILSLYDQVESHESERLSTVRSRILKAAEELSVKMEGERFEQEMIFYLEKFDINEEKVRLREHCRYFLTTLDAEAYPGRKLAFIVQEMGREINTTGSKANHAEIQKLVVQMKDELEKIREQSMNIL